MITSNEIGKYKKDDDGLSLPWYVVIDCGMFDYIVTDFKTELEANTFKSVVQPISTVPMEIKNKVRRLTFQMKKAEICVSCNVTQS